MDTGNPDGTARHLLSALGGRFTGYEGIVFAELELVDCVIRATAEWRAANPEGTAGDMADALQDRFPGHVGVLRSIFYCQERDAVVSAAVREWRAANLDGTASQMAAALKDKFPVSEAALRGFLARVDGGGADDAQDAVKVVPGDRGAIT